MLDVDSDTVLGAIKNYEAIEEICIALGANANVFSADHWSTIDTHGLYEGELVYWDHLEQMVSVVTEEELSMKHEAYLCYVYDNEKKIEAMGEEAADHQLAELGISIILMSARRQYADRIFDAYDTDFSGASRYKTCLRRTNRTYSCDNQGLF